jgi:hypothetical protein
MSDLMPDVSLDESSGEDPETVQEKKKSTQEEQNSSTSEERSGGAAAQKSGSSDTDAPSSSSSTLEIYPKQSPDLSEKLGLLVSNEVEELLDEAYLSMRMEHGKKAKKSLIVEAALRYLLNDYQQNGAADSELSRWMQRVAE